MNPISKLQFGTPYIASPQASTELHAGGIFFCIPYEERITFFEDGRVELRRKVIEDFRPMDNQDVDAINDFFLKGSYRLSGRRYILCEFGKRTMTGLPLNDNPDILAFHVHEWSQGIAYKISDQSCISDS